MAAAPTEDMRTVIYSKIRAGGDSNSHYGDFTCVDDTEVVAGTTLIKADAANQKWELKVVENNSGDTVVADQGRVEIALAEIQGKHAKFRQVCVKVGGVAKAMWVLGTEPE